MEPPQGPASSDVRDQEHIDEQVGAQRATRIRWLAAIMLVAVLIGAAGYLGGLRLQQHQKDVAAAQALEAARKYALTLSNIDANTIDQNFAEILDGSTGEFKDLHTKSGARLRQLLIDHQATAHGTVVEAAVKSAGTSKVEVLLLVDQAVSNVALPTPEIDRSRIKMTMEKVDGRWLVSKVELR